MKSNTSPKKTLIFYFDIVCPYSYIASKLIGNVCSRHNTTLIWRPVLLGGIYKQSNAPQGKDGSATDVMSPNKRKMHAFDLHRMLAKHNIPFKFNSNHPNKTIHAQRILAFFEDNVKVRKLAEAFYEAYWVLNEDVNDIKTLRNIIKRANVDVPSAVLEDRSEISKANLLKNTQEVVDRGAFGVPSYYIEPSQKFIFGADRLNFVEKYLNDGKKVEQVRLYRTPFTKRQKLTFFYDFSSPWAYIASTQVERVAKECNAELEFVPILLGALFKEVGTPNVPMLAVSEAKRVYYAEDMLEWTRWWGIDFNFNKVFPLRSVLPLRINILEPKTFHLFYKAAWVQNLNIGDVDVVLKLLNEAGFNGNELIKKANESQAKEQLKYNTVRAKEEGLFGVPTFQVNDKELVWGQDKLDFVEDMLCGWKPEENKPVAKL